MFRLFHNELPEPGRHVLILHISEGDIPKQFNSVWCHVDTGFFNKDMELEDSFGAPKDVMAGDCCWTYVDDIAREAIKTGFNNSLNLVFEGNGNRIQGKDGWDMDPCPTYPEE